MAFSATGHRLTLAPDVAAPDIIMMAGAAGNSRPFVKLVAEEDRSLLPGLKAGACQSAEGLGVRGPGAFGPQGDRHHREQ